MNNRAAAEEFLDVTWVLEDLAGKEPVQGSPATITFTGDGTVAGSAGRNRFSGTFESEGDAIRIGEALASTMMAGPDDVMAQERDFLSALAAARHVTVEDDLLILSNDSYEELARFVAQPLNPSGTWSIIAYNNGKQAVVSLLADTSAELTLNDDGSFTGSGGVNRLRGSWRSTGHEFSIGPILSGRMAGTPEVMEQESGIIKALESATTFRLEADALELRTDDNALAARLSR